ncbi:MAG: F0F1 ATP synthase subunit B [Gammaproteobacteria bacterium]|nr:F0F1 ATP synthase subunit B [Gammaproteobacteria bacterium]
MDFNLTLIGQTVAMIVFVWFCMRFIWPPVMNAIEQRRKEIADGIAAGDKGQRELADARHGAESILQDARQKATQVADMAHKRSNEMVAEAKEHASAEGERIVAAARTELVTSQTKARDALRREVAALAVAGATRVLGREVDAKSHATLLDELAAELEKQAPTHG